MKFDELARFDVVHAALPWPWLAFDARGAHVAYASATDHLSVRALLEDGSIGEPRTFALPKDLALPTTSPSEGGDEPAGLRGFAVHPTGVRLALIGRVEATSVVVTFTAEGELKRSALGPLVGEGFVARAVAFDRTGARLWLSVEKADGAALVLLDADSHAVLGQLPHAPFSPPSVHELFVHPQDDAVLLLAACGTDGTFARVAGWSSGPPEAIPTALDQGGIAAGFVGFSTDGSRVHLVEAYELRTHAWPGLEELSSVELADDFVSSYSGAVLGDRIFLDGDLDGEEGEAMMTFDRSATQGSMATPPVPSGMWAGRLGLDVVVTVSAKGDPAEGRIVRIPRLLS